MKWEQRNFLRPSGQRQRRAVTSAECDSNPMCSNVPPPRPSAHLRAAAQIWFQFSQIVLREKRTRPRGRQTQSSTLWQQDRAVVRTQPPALAPGHHVLPRAEPRHEVAPPAHQPEAALHQLRVPQLRQAVPGRGPQLWWVVSLQLFLQTQGIQNNTELSESTDIFWRTLYFVMIYLCFTSD